MQWIENLKLVLSIFPALINAIKTIESAIPVESKGGDKLSLLKDVLQTTFDNSTKTVNTFEQVWPMLQSVIMSIVNAFNATGVFKAKV
jgi:hypothetical protein